MLRKARFIGKARELSTALRLSGLALTICVIGCAHKTGFVGTWKDSTAGNGALTTMTFNADHTMSFVATNGPKQERYKLTGQGTWSASGDSLSVVPLSMQFDDVTAEQRAKLKPYVEKELNVAASAPVVWKGPNAFVLVKNGIEQNFKRVE